jgi:hypothetical protein
MGSIDSDEFRALTSDVIPTPNRNRKSLLRSFRFPCKVNGETAFGYYFTPNRPIDTRISSIDSDEFRASTSDVIPTPNRNRKSLLRSFRFTCKVSGETAFGYYFTPYRPIYTRMGSIDSDEFRASTSDVIPTPNRNRKSLLRSFRFTCKVNRKLLSATTSPQIVRFTRGWARSTRTNSGHRPVTSYRHRTGTGSRYYARSDLHAKSTANYFRLLLHPKSSDLHADGLDRLGQIAGVDQ